MRKITLITLVPLVIILNLNATPPANAHIVTKATCMRYWEQAPPGTKFAALSKCHRFVEAHRLAHLCQLKRPLLSRRLTVKHVRATKHQRIVLTRALNTARIRRNIRVKTYAALVAGITQESTAYNKPAGDGSSVGVLQLVDSWGSVDWRMHIPNSVNWFLNGVIPDDRAHPRLPLSRLVQNQQGSAHPNAYAQWEGEAYRTVRLFLGPCKR